MNAPWKAPAVFALPEPELHPCDACGHGLIATQICRECAEYLKAGFGVSREAIRAALMQEVAAEQSRAVTARLAAGRRAAKARREGGA
jgi:hypothetical protein